MTGQGWKFILFWVSSYGVARNDSFIIVTEAINFIYMKLGSTVTISHIHSDGRYQCFFTEKSYCTLQFFFVWTFI